MLQRSWARRQVAQTHKPHRRAPWTSETHPCHRRQPRRSRWRCRGRPVLVRQYPLAATPPLPRARVHVAAAGTASSHLTGPERCPARFTSGADRSSSVRSVRARGGIQVVSEREQGGAAVEEGGSLASLPRRLVAIARVRAVSYAGRDDRRRRAHTDRATRPRPRTLAPPAATRRPIDVHLARRSRSSAPRSGCTDRRRCASQCGAMHISTQGASTAYRA